MPACLSSRAWCTLDAFVEDGPVLGRRVANTTFLRALLRADPFDSYHFFLPDIPSGKTLSNWLEEEFPPLLRRNALRIEQQSSLAERLAGTRYHCLHLADPLARYALAAQLRNALAPFIFPITGVTHSLSYARFMPEYAQHLWPGVSSRDALMVTSKSAGLVLERIFQSIRRGYSLDPAAFPAPRLALVPLGVDMETLPDPKERWENASSQGRAMRERLDIGDEPVFLSLSRLDPYSKMDLMPLFSAFRRAESLGLPAGGYTLILAGWAETDDELPEALRRYAASMGIRVRIRLRPTAEERRALYAAADIFVSPSDNIQETFGLTVAEAGGASLPAIASDFDGYRDIILHNETGLLIPTLGFAETPETDLQALFWFDNQYHLKLSQQTVVQTSFLAEAIARLGSDALLRRRMGLAARERISSLFSWDQVIKRMVALWDDLAAKELCPGEEENLRAAVHPLRMPFAQAFQGHFSQTLSGEVLNRLSVRATPAGLAVYRKALPLLSYAGLEHFLNQDLIRRLLLAARKPIPAAALMERLDAALSADLPGLPPPLRRERAAFTLLWALKQDYLEPACP